MIDQHVQPLMANQCAWWEGGRRVRDGTIGSHLEGASRCAGLADFPGPYCKMHTGLCGQIEDGRPDCAQPRAEGSGYCARHHAEADAWLTAPYHWNCGRCYTSGAASTQEESRKGLYDHILQAHRSTDPLLANLIEELREVREANRILLEERERALAIVVEVSDDLWNPLTVIVGRVRAARSLLEPKSVP